MILIPSYSTGDHDFEQALGKLLSEDCCAIWTNACSVVRKQSGGKTGMVLQAGKARVDIKERYKEFTCSGDCAGQDCAETAIEICELYYDRDVS